jgi:hypothetical protein
MDVLSPLRDSVKANTSFSPFGASRSAPVVSNIGDKGKPTSVFGSSPFAKIFYYSIAVADSRGSGGCRAAVFHFCCFAECPIRVFLAMRRTSTLKLSQHPRRRPLQHRCSGTIRPPRLYSTPRRPPFHRGKLRARRHPQHLYKLRRNPQ